MPTRFPPKPFFRYPSSKDIWSKLGILFKMERIGTQFKERGVEEGANPLIYVIISPYLPSVIMNYLINIKIQTEIIEMLIFFLRYQKYCIHNSLQSHEM